MAGRISITIIKDTAYLHSDKVQFEVDGDVQPDQMRIWGTDRRTMGFGHEPFGTGAFGHAAGPGFGDGPFGKGVFGIGADTNTYQSSQNYPAGDYSVRARTYDDLGNTQGWSSPETVSHRPTPAAPKALTINPTTGELCWLWDINDG